MHVKPKCERILGCRYDLNGWVGDYVRNITEHWLKVAPSSNPGLLEMFRDRDRLPLRGHWGHEGEYPGKYLTGAVEMFRLTHDNELHRVLEEFVQTLIAYQDDDGYLGPWPKGSRLTGYAPNCVVSKNAMTHHGPGNTWDAWGHYHLMYALMLWHEETGDRRALNCVRKMADLLCRIYLDGDRRLIDTGNPVNLSPIHALAILYRKTRVERYLRLALKITEDFPRTTPEGRLAGNYIEDALEGKELYQTANPRWEMLHVLMGIGELYPTTGEDAYRRVFTQYWWGITRLDRHNNGAFSSDEEAVGNPYHPGSIETCCTIAWIAMSIEMLRMTGNSIIADEIELSTLNSVAGLFSSSGRWVTYHTPMDGIRDLFKMSKNWQARRGTAEFSCCSANAPRGFGMISEWAVMRDEEGVLLNYYGPCRMKAEIRSGLSVALKQETEYPRKGTIRLTVSPSRETQFVLKLRIPCWSKKTRVRVNGRRIGNVRPGEYLRLDRRWKRGDRVEIALDMSWHFWVGAKECEGKVSMYRGPILMTYDRRYNDFPPGDVPLPEPVTVGGTELEPDVPFVRDDIPTLDATTLKGRFVRCRDWHPPFMLMEVQAPDGRKVRLCDFASAGETGTPYRSWLKIDGVRKTRFSRSNPLRSGRPT